ncbi:uncharacterized protein DUF4148 [Paraburkholderia eburnea]|uniref:Uncharacterized protein DUF4148 n=1 Tax=Paraburkholderia eburnea TaxID=1189126 RepID=A0A2S4MNS1_9BURK|nr:DUF4148 domain-containing protein [Paraburkholderia eburnea]POR56396.1 uncharacterized protein DUF4148 [Paraburkholderia eburnea]PRZ27523.1 uncharacterized protein DUF4148 [Paraburkholderia eburnea]
MKKTVSLAALVLAAATAFAAAPAFASANLSKTRAEVKAELAQARASGEMQNPNAPDYPQQFATGGYTVPRVQIATPHAR